jgi:hypothetical protein
MTVAECQERVSAEEFREWIAFYKFNPWGEERDDLRIGNLTALTANIHRRKGAREFKASDFILFGHGKSEREQSAKEMRATFAAFAKMHNRRFAKEQ